MPTAKIIGAGSIGNHLAHSCRSKGWDVTICDIDSQALQRTKNDIYPSRYGSWDEAITLAESREVAGQAFDVVLIGTPPDSHIQLAMAELEAAPPKVLMLEKPLCTPSLEGAQELRERVASLGVKACVGYNHVLNEHTLRAEELLRDNVIGQPLSITARFREHWAGIFGAHPWLQGPHDTYLGYWQRGGGASGEHSHAMNIWQHFAHVCKMGRITQLNAMLDMVKDDAGADYDRMCTLSVKTEKGLFGDISQDVITNPPLKHVRVQGDKGYLEWVVNHTSDSDALFYRTAEGEGREELFPKNRPKDFEGEVNHIQALLEGASVDDSPISLDRGLDTMLVLAATHLSWRDKRFVSIDYEAGCVPEAITAF